MSFGDWVRNATDWLAGTDTQDGNNRANAVADGNAARDKLYSTRVDLSKGFNGQYADHVLNGKVENFQSYDQIKAFLDAIDLPGLDQNGADWGKLAGDVDDSTKTFRSGLHGLIDNAWTGQFANKAKDGVNQYVDGEDHLMTAAKLMQNKIQEFGSGVEEAKKQLPAGSQDTTWRAGNSVLGWVPIVGAWSSGISNAVADDQASTKAAQSIMSTVYTPVAHQADDQVPLMPAPVNPVAAVPQANNPLLSPNTGPSSYNPALHAPGGLPGANSPSDHAPNGAPTTDHSGATGPSADNGNHNGTGANNQDGQKPGANDPSAQTSAAAADSPLDPSLGLGGNGLGGYGGGLGGPGGDGSPLASPTLGGTTVGPQAPNMRGMVPAAGAAGAGGMPGMGMGGKKKEEDKEHKTPKWLYSTENGEALLDPSGKGQPVSPGVLGLIDAEGYPVDMHGRRLGA